MSHNPNVRTIYGMSKEPSGFPNRTDSTVSFDNSTLTLSVAPVSSSFEYYIKGVKYTYLSPATKQITDTEGLWHFYFDGYTLQATQTFTQSIITDFAYVALIYWDAANNQAIYFGEERHGMTMDGSTHIYLHNVNGAVYVNGLGLGDFTVDGTGTNSADGYFSVANGVIYDEDIIHNITDGAPQDIAPIARLPVFFREGLAGNWRRKSAEAFPVVYPGSVAGYDLTNTRLAYNDFNGTTWSLQQATNGNFILVHVLATNDKVHPIIAVLGINQYNNTNSARTGAVNELATLSGLPFSELVPVGTVIFQTSNGYTNAIKGRVVSTDTGDAYVDFRNVAALPIGQINDHGNLSGLTDTDHPATAIYTNTSNFNGILSSANTTVQSALDAIDNISLLSGSGSANRVAFWGGASSLSSSANLAWDNTGTGKLGIGTASPSARLHSVAAASSAGYFAATGAMPSGSAVLSSEGDVSSSQDSAHLSIRATNSGGTGRISFVDIPAGVSSGLVESYFANDPNFAVPVGNIRFSTRIGNSTGGPVFERVNITSSELVINSPKEGYDLRVNGISRSHLLYVYGVGERVGINNAVPEATLDISNGTAEEAALIVRDDATPALTVNDGGSITIGDGGTSYTLPTARGINGQVLQIDGYGSVTWQTPAGSAGMAIGGSITGATQNSILFAGAGGVLAQNNANLSWNDGYSSLNVAGTITADGVSIDNTSGLSLSNTSSSKYAAATLPILSSSVNNYNIGTGTFFRLSFDEGYGITGITGGEDGRVIHLSNVGSGSIYISNEGAGSTDVNRIVTGNGQSLVIPVNAIASLIYDGTAQRWNVLSQPLDVIPVGNGGTGATTLTGYLKGNGSSGFTSSATIPGSDVSGNIAGNAANVTGTVSVTSGGTGTTTQFTQGSIIFAGASGVYSQDVSPAPALSWSTANKTLLVNSSLTNVTPTATLEVRGSGIVRSNSGNSANAFRVQTSTGADILNVSTSGSSVDVSSRLNVNALDRSGSGTLTIGAVSASAITITPPTTIEGLNVGRGPGAQITNTVLGQTAGGASFLTGTNLTCIGNGSTPSAVSATNQITLGNSSVAQLRCNVTTITTLSDARDKAEAQDLTLGIDFLSTVRPVQFKWDRREWYDNRVSDGSKKSNIFEPGFLAQELDAAQAAAGAEWMALVSKDNPDQLEATPMRLFPVVVKACQELYEKNKELEARLAALENNILAILQSR